MYTDSKGLSFSKEDRIANVLRIGFVARAGELKGFTGIDDPYETPKDADIVIDTLTCTPEEAAKQILKHLQEKNMLLKKLGIPTFLWVLTH